MADTDLLLGTTMGRLDEMQKALKDKCDQDRATEVELFKQIDAIRGDFIKMETSMKIEKAKVTGAGWALHNIWWVISGAVGSFLFLNGGPPEWLKRLFNS